MFEIRKLFYQNGLTRSRSSIIIMPRVEKLELFKIWRYKMQLKSEDAKLIENIKRIIDINGIKKCKVADKIGLSGAEFSRMLNGRRAVRACYVPAIAEALGVTPNELFAGVDRE